MNKKFFKKYKNIGPYGGYDATFCVVSDGEIIAESDWKEDEEILNPEWTIYQCYRPEVCVEDFMEKQRRLSELRDRVEELHTEQSVLRKLLGSKLPIDQPVLFGDIIVTMDEEGFILFQKAISPTEL
jgi:tetrahydromethanopterin S-methyltransferase subunit G